MPASVTHSLDLSGRTRGLLFAGSEENAARTAEAILSGWGRGRVSRCGGGELMLPGRLWCIPTVCSLGGIYINLYMQCRIAYRLGSTLYSILQIPTYYIPPALSKPNQTKPRSQSPPPTTSEEETPLYIEGSVLPGTYCTCTYLRCRRGTIF